MHGGSAPQVARSARERLDGLVDPAIVGLARVLRGRSNVAVVAAARDVLDRAGLGPPERMTVGDAQSFARAFVDALNEAGLTPEQRLLFASAARRRVAGSAGRLSPAVEQAGLEVCRD
jgi:hypothetical protein